MSRTLALRLAVIEAHAALTFGNQYPFVDRPPRETREEWLARRAAGLRWDRPHDGAAWALVLEPAQ